MLSLSSQLRLKHVILAIAKHEQEIEHLRQQLSQIEHFEPYSSYRLLDTINKKELGAEDFLHFFR